MGLSPWFTFDPVTKVLFEDIEVRNGKIATIGILICSDSTIYNKQVLYLEDAINLAIEDVVECQYELYVPTYNRTPNLFDGMMGKYQKEKGYVYTTQYWDEEKKKRVLEQTDDQKPFLIKEITDEENAISVVSEGIAGKRCYMYMPGAGEQLADTIRKSFDIIEEKNFTANDFIVYSIIF